MRADAFSDERAWLGGWYELALELGARDDERLNAAFVAIWERPALEGCYASSNVAPCDQTRIAPSHWHTQKDLGFDRSYGVATLSNGVRVPCLTSSVLASSDDDFDWISLALPMAGLAQVVPDAAGYPAGEALDRPNLWRHELNDWLAEIGVAVAAAVPYRLGLIGWEISGTAGLNDAETFRREGPPESRHVAYLIPAKTGVDYRRMSKP